MGIIEVNNLTFGYLDKEVLKNVSFAVEQPSIVTILGPNGCGKSTLMENMVGYLQGNKGEVLIKNKVVCAYTDRERAKTYTFVQQQQGVRFPYQCLDFVLLGRRPHHERFEALTDRDYAVTEKYMKLTKTYDFAKRPIHTLSGGEFQRLLFAKALVQETDIIFLDEAFSAMDIHYKVQNLQLLKALAKKEQKTIVCVMHDMNMAYQFSDFIVLMDNGKVHQFGTPNQVLTEETVYDVYGIYVEKIKNKGFVILANS